MFCNWLNYVDTASVFIYISFRSNPELTGVINFGEGDMENFLLKDILFMKKGCKSQRFMMITMRT